MSTWKCPTCGTTNLTSSNECSNPRCPTNQKTGHVWECEIRGHWNPENKDFCVICGRPKPANPRWARG
jgi:hypothetical protein